MKEIGGYIEVEYYKGKMLYDDGVKINCGRNALEYIILAKKIKRILMPRFMCDSCNGVLARNSARETIMVIESSKKEERINNHLTERECQSGVS